MNKNKCTILSVCIMLLLAFVLYSIVRFIPESLVIILGVFAVPGFLSCGYILYLWIISPDNCLKRTCLPATHSRKKGGEKIEL